MKKPVSKIYNGERSQTVNLHFDNFLGDAEVISPGETVLVETGKSEGGRTRKEILETISIMRREFQRIPCRNN